MAEAFIEDAPGEVRAAVVVRRRLVEMHVARCFDGVQPGAVLDARVGEPRPGGVDAVLATGEEAFLPVRGLSRAAPPQGTRLRVEVVREAIPEAGRLRPAVVRVARDGAAPCAAPTLAERLAGAGVLVRAGPFPGDVADAWERHWGEAEAGQVAIADGLLILAPTPALLAVDVDGAPDPCVAAAAVARAIRLFGVGGSIAIDFPGVAAKGWRQAAAAAFDAAMAGAAFERTAVNGFGLLHVVRPRVRRSILERARFERDATAALGLLAAARAEAQAGARPGARAGARLVLTARPGVVALLEGRREVLDRLALACGRAIDLAADPAAGEGHVRAA